MEIESKVFSSNGSLRTNFIPIDKKKELEEYDIIHVQGSPYGSEIGRLKIPKVVTVHTLLKDEVKFDRWNMAFKIGQSFEERTFKNANFVIIVNECLQDTLLSYSVEPDKVSVIMNGVNVEEFDAIETNNRIGVLYGGRKAKRKNYDMIKSAIEKLKIQYKTFGFDKYLPRAELLKYYKNSKMFVSASDYETGPITVMEAMAAKCPVIAKKIDGMKWARNYYLSFENFEGLVNCIDLLNEDEIYAPMSDKAYKLIKNNFKWSNIARKTVKVYEKVCASAGF